MKVHHVGYLVDDMNGALNEFSRLGYEIVQKTVYDPLRKINICFVENGGVMVELIEPCKDCRLFTSLQKRIGNAPYHLCYVINDRGGGYQLF